MKKTLLFFLLMLLLITAAAQAAPAPGAPQAGSGTPPPVDYIKGVVLSVSPLDDAMRKQYFLEPGELVKLRLTTGPETGKEVDTFNFVNERSPYAIKVEPGDKVVVAVAYDMGRTSYHISDFDRFDYVYWLLALFAGSLILFAGLVGVRSLFVIGFSTVLIFYVYIGQALAAKVNLTLLTLLVCALIASVTQVSISGWNRKSLAAVLGTVGGVIIAGLLSIAAIKLMHLTGLESEEAMLLKASRLAAVDFQGVLFSGMVFGALGAVMDVAISIASALYEVKAVQPDMDRKSLFLTGMNVGRDIMGTMSNTLILAYVGSSLPLMLLIASQSQVSMTAVMNLNLITTEIARALTGSIGLIFAIPLTAFISAFLMRSDK